MDSPKDIAARDAYLDMVRTLDHLSADFLELFRAAGLSEPQYNVLRILRGAGEPVPCQYIGERLLRRVPDVTRLLDRLEQAGLVTRARGRADRRKVLVALSPRGSKLVDSLDRPVMELHRRQFDALPLKDIRALGGVLRRLRERASAR